MIKKLLFLLVLLLTATTTWAVSNRLYLDVSGTSATLKYDSDYDGKPNYSSGTWSTDDVKTTVQTITTDATSCANFSGTTLKSLFEQFTALTSVDLSGLNTANVTNMAYMFNGCKKLTSFNLSGLNTDKVTAINSMFNDCSSLTSADLSGLNTANVTAMNNLFGGCTSLTSVDLSGLNTSKVTKMASMFNSCSSLTSVDLSSWDTSSATSMGSMFESCSSLTTVNLSSFNTSNVTIMGGMFESCSSLTTVDLSSFNTSKVTSMSNMFYSCTNLTNIYVGNDWSTDAVNNSDNMFKLCTKLPNFNSSKLDHTNAHTGEGGYLKVKAKTYKVTLQEGTEDADKWTIPAEAEEGATVTATYSGSKKVKSVKAVKKGGAADPMLATPMTIEAITAGSIKVENPKADMQYSLDGGATKYTVTTGNIALNAGDKVQFYGNGTSITCYGDPEMSKCTMIKGSGDGFTCKVYGNIMSLVDEKNFATATTLSDIYTFKFLFYNNPTLTDASRLLLPATQLQESCYMQMFNGCDALTAAPALPAETLAYGCYQQMFNGCTALTAAPVLPATKLVSYCYNLMFNNCSKLATVTCLATSGFKQTECTSYWLNAAGSQAEGTKTVYTVRAANWPSGVNGIPDDWERGYIDN